MPDWNTMSPAIDRSSIVAHAISLLNRPSLLDDVSPEQTPGAALESRNNALPPSPPSSFNTKNNSMAPPIDWETSSSTPESEADPFLLPVMPSVSSPASTCMPTPMLISDLLEWESLSSTFDADFNLSAPSNAHTSFVLPDDTIGANIGGPVDFVETQPSKSMDMYGAITQVLYPVAVTDDFWSTKSNAELSMAIKEEDQWKKTATAAGKTFGITNVFFDTIDDFPKYAQECAGAVP
ncbi:26S proteasome regulatory complex, subunit RPN10/PSMD4 [Moesziomyces antarcticus T-34]|uniref:26S proteasome regulatory complex, subunit RPN10/PSMD4 n=1 Tax=Pseudozyma antarctica (strain T-34) TaxID=1151754 RepID=M9M099_PSEA3|nr:26S proteasome regulatory complex, subunit RPN10/PSMD4 [Moesziomyces antarcticus T-34]